MFASPLLHPPSGLTRGRSSTLVAILLMGLVAHQATTPRPAGTPVSPAGVGRPGPHCRSLRNG